jgi:hypothetical protein
MLGHRGFESSMAIFLSCHHVLLFFCFLHLRRPFLSFFLSLPIRLMVPPVADVTPASCQYPNPQYPSATHQANIIVPPYVLLAPSLRFCSCNNPFRTLLPYMLRALIEKIAHTICPFMMLRNMVSRTMN